MMMVVINNKVLKLVRGGGGAEESLTKGWMMTGTIQWEFAGTPIVYTPCKNAPRSFGCRGAHQLGWDRKTLKERHLFYRIAELEQQEQTCSLRSIPLAWCLRFLMVMFVDIQGDMARMLALPVQRWGGQRVKEVTRLGIYMYLRPPFVVPPGRG